MKGARFWRRALAGALAVLALAVVSLAPHVVDPAERVRLRNALLLDAVDTASFDWTPATVPADFVVEQAPPSEAFRRRVDALGLDTLESDWERALAIARHLLAHRQGRVGHAIQSDLERTYEVIRASGEGYCGDFTDVFAALALAAGLPVRAWAFSFDGFGGNGHVFNEVWDRGSQRWRLIDVFHNYYFTGADGTPVSALEFRAALARDPAALEFHPIEPRARPVFQFEPRAREFYQRGLGEWYLWWGNAVYSYDGALLVRALGPLSRSLEQLGAIVQDVHPRIRVLVDDGNRARVQALQRLKTRLLATFAIALAAAAAALACAIGWRRARRRGLA